MSPCSFVNAARLLRSKEMRTRLMLRHQMARAPQGSCFISQHESSVSRTSRTSDHSSRVYYSTAKAAKAMTPLYLGSILADPDISSSDTAQDEGPNAPIVLEPWNDAVESFLLNGHSDFTHANRVGITELHSAASIESVSIRVRDLLLGTIYRLEHGQDSKVDNSSTFNPEIILQGHVKLERFCTHFHEPLLDSICLKWVQHLSILVRTCKNIIRFYRYLRSTHKDKRQEGMTLDSFVVSPIHNLQSSTMIYIYVAVFDWATRMSTVLSSSMDPMQVLDIFCNLAKHSATLLFHATFSFDHTDVESNKALHSLVHDIGTFNSSGLSILLNHLSQILSSTLFYSSILYPVMKTLQTLLVTLPVEKIRPIVQRTFLDRETFLFSMLVITLQSCLRSHPHLISNQTLLCEECKVEPFIPGLVSHLPDYRLELMIETLRVLFALENRKMTSKDPDTMNLLHHILVDILRFPRTIKTQECKIASLPLFMDASHVLATTLVTYDTIPEFVYILATQLNDAFFKSQAATCDSNAAVPIRFSSNVTGLLPILMALLNLCIKNSTIQSRVRETVFPKDEEKLFLEELHRHDGQDVILDQQSGITLVAKNMHPLYAPAGSLRWQLIQLMTSIQTNVKRCTTELMWILCNHDKNEFVLRTGFGNAVHFLGVKGLVNISSLYNTNNTR